MTTSPPAGPRSAQSPAGLLVALGLVLAVVAVVVGSLLDAHASSGPLVHRRDAVAASTPATGPVVASLQRVLAGQHRARAPNYDGSAVGSSVAPEGGGAFGEIGPAGNPGSLRTVIGKVHALEADGAIGSGERSLVDRLPDQGSPRANWAQNEGVLRQEMRRGMPIRDASIDPITGELVDNTGFLKAERYLLQDRGWGFDPRAGTWNPPAR